MTPALSKIAVTPGEPAGIGPDLIVQLAHHSWDAILTRCVIPLDASAQ